MTSLDSTGEQFMELISSYGNWRTDFDKMKEIGIPQLNEASLIYNLLQGGYCIVPITKDKEIVSVALYPVSIKNGKNLTTTSPNIITEEESKNNEFIQSLLGSKLLNSWLEKGYSVKFEKEDIIVNYPSLSRFDGVPFHQHVFCFVLWCTIYPQHYFETMERAIAYADVFRQSMQSAGAEIRSNDKHCCVIFPADEISYVEAHGLYQQKVINFYTDILSIGYTENVEFAMVWEFEWRDEYAPGGGGGGSDNQHCPYGKCSGNPCTCCSICQGPCKCPVCHKDPCECIRDILLTVKSTTTGEMAVVRAGMMGERYDVPLYNVVLNATDDNGNTVVENYVAIRFGVKIDENDVAVVKGLQDEMTYTVSEFVSAYCGESPAGDAWRIFGGHLLHAGPKNMKLGCNMYGCVGICNGRMGELNQKLLLYSNAKTEQALAASGKFKIHVEAASKPPLVRSKD